jgi:SAM-dependent methyltransferase
MYEELASWWPLLSSPADYVEEAAFYERTLAAACQRPLRTVLELGSGGGNNASHLKARFQMVLVEPSAGMLEVSRALNPECEHVEGDMRTVRLGRRFDSVFVHDAVGYMTTQSDLRMAIDTAFLHCLPGGRRLRARFRPGELPSFDGPWRLRDGETRGLRYLEWTWDPDPADSTYVVDYAYLLRMSDGAMRVEHDRHVEGLFTRADWLGLLSEAGFQPRAVPLSIPSWNRAPTRYSWRKSLAVEVTTVVPVTAGVPAVVAVTVGDDPAAPVRNACTFPPASAVLREVIKPDVVVKRTGCRHRLAACVVNCRDDGGLWRRRTGDDGGRKRSLRHARRRATLLELQAVSRDRRGRESIPSSNYSRRC